MDDGASSRVHFGDDILVEILQRLPPKSRRRSRLLCRRTVTDVGSRAKTLLVSKGDAYVLDDNWSVKRVMASRKDRVMEVVGTCNALICLCDDSKPGAAIELANGERLVLPPLPCSDIDVSGRPEWHEAYSFAHHQMTGRYKVVHVPCCFDRVWQFERIQVFTLGETSWRDVATPAAGGAGLRCLGKAGIVSVDGATYWVAEATGRIMSFDLEDERVKSVVPLPVPLPTRSGSSFRLAEYGRLGVAIFHDSVKLEKTDVWVLESARGEQRWRRWYCVETNPRRNGLLHRLTLPHFAHDKHVLTHRNGTLYSHEPDGTQKKSRYGMVQISELNRGKVAATVRVDRAFAM